MRGLAPLLALAGCVEDHPQSALHPAGPAAAEIAWLTWALLAVLTVVFVVTMVLAGVAVVRRPPEAGAAPELGVRFVVMAGIVLPSIVLVGILVLTLQAIFAIRGGGGPLTVRVIGHQFWWEVVYPDLGVVTANDLILPAGERVRIELLSGDVIHSFWVPNLAGKMDMLPDRPNLFQLRADRPGRWRGVCAEYCGTQHAWMAFGVQALPRAEFDAWAAARRAPPPEPVDPELVRGRRAFLYAGCAACHAVRGLSDARRGPDLTHLASRPTLGAGVLPNTPEDLRAWLRDPQRFKPGNLMPRSELPDDDLDALVRWLGSLP